jgi:hypothetical protein
VVIIEGTVGIYAWNKDSLQETGCVIMAGVVGVSLGDRPMK